MTKSNSLAVLGDESLDKVGGALVEVDLRPAQDRQLTGELVAHAVDLAQILVGPVVAKAGIGRNVIDVVGDRDLGHARPQSRPGTSSPSGSCNRPKTCCERGNRTRDLAL